MKTREFFERLLAERVSALTEVAAFIDENPREDLYVEYKNGASFKDARAIADAKLELRRQVSAFANSDGGVILYGVSDPEIDRGSGTVTTKPAIAACPAHINGTELRAWMRDVVRDMTPFFGQVPLFPEPIDVGGGDVVQAIVVTRAPALVPCVEGRELRFYMRFGDATLPADPWLLTDLQLGRRRHPRFTVDAPADFRERASSSYLFGGEGPVFTPEFQVANDSLVHAKNVRAGFVGYRYGASPRPIANSLRQQVHVVEAAADRGILTYERLVFSPRPLDPAADTRTLPPHEVDTLRLGSSWLLPSVVSHESRVQRWCGALYLAAEDSETRWFQVTVSHRAVKMRSDPGELTMTVEPVWGVRPTIEVGLHPLAAPTEPE